MTEADRRLAEADEGLTNVLWSLTRYLRVAPDGPHRDLVGEARRQLLDVAIAMRRVTDDIRAKNKEDMT